MSGGVKLTLPQAFAELNLSLCGQYKGMNPIELLDYPAEDVFQLINDMIDHNDRAEAEKAVEKEIRVPAGDNWF